MDRVCNDPYWAAGSTVSRVDSLIVFLVAFAAGFAFLAVTDFLFVPRSAILIGTVFSSVMVNGTFAVPGISSIPGDVADLFICAAPPLGFVFFDFSFGLGSDFEFFEAISSATKASLKFASVFLKSKGGFLLFGLGFDFEFVEAFSSASKDSFKAANGFVVRETCSTERPRRRILVRLIVVFLAVAVEVLASSAS